MIAGLLTARSVLAACVLGGAACSDVSFVDGVTIVNDTEYSANVDVTGRDGGGWLGLTVVRPESSRTVGEAIDE